MKVDPRLNEIDDCLYRVATKAIITQGDRVLMVKEIPEMWWAFPGGGVDHGETIESSLVREVEEEVGVPAKEVVSDFKIVYYTIGKVVNGVPRMNLLYKVTVPEELLGETGDVAEWHWFTEDEFMSLNMSPSYDDRIKLAEVIFREKE